ncbi:MAG: GntR family transcriptional regulator [Bacteroidales bacterium]|nr:GntR family transcriptional regulator [Bacteroidales bacterium]
MEFNAHKPIYLQICSQLYEQILRGELKADDRILSVRDYGIQLGVNPNTIMRSYETMTTAGIIYNKRGIGYFISAEAKDIVLRQMREEFITKELPEVVKKMKLLGIGLDDIKSLNEL